MFTSLILAFSTIRFNILRNQFVHDWLASRKEHFSPNHKLCVNTLTNHPHTYLDSIQLNKIILQFPCLFFNFPPNFDLLIYCDTILAHAAQMYKTQKAQVLIVESYSLKVTTFSSKICLTPSFTAQSWQIPFHPHSLGVTSYDPKCT